MQEVHLEPKDMWSSPAENCVDCRRPTRYWLDEHVPLCPACVKSRNEAKVPTQKELEIVRDIVRRCRGLAQIALGERHEGDPQCGYWQGKADAYSGVADDVERDYFGDIEATANRI